MQFAFDASQVAPQVAMEPLPTDWYKVAIEETEMKPTSDNTGHYLQLGMKVLEGQFAGRKVFARLNLYNKNATASEIAFRQLSAICHAIGVMQIQDTQQLHGRPMEVRVVVRPAENGYDASNDVKGFRAVGSGQPAQSPMGQQPGQPPRSFGPPPGPVAAPQFVPPQGAAQAPQTFAPPQGAPMQQPAYNPPAGAPVGGAGGGGQPWAQPAPTQYQPPAQQFAPPPAQGQGMPQQGGAPATPPWARPQQ